jgi:hypothetical protein
LGIFGPKPILPARDAILLLCVLTVAHAPLFINNGLIADDWWIFRVKPGYPTQINFLLYGAGHPIAYIYCAIANFTDHPIAFMKALAIIGILLGALNLRIFLGRLRIFSEFEAQFLTYLVWTYAGFQVWTAKFLATYIFDLALLCLGLNLFATIATSKQPSARLRLSALVALFCSFALNSMMVAYLVGLVAVFVLRSLADHGRLAPLLWLKRWPDFIALPFVYWFSAGFFFPKLGPYTEYYHVRVPDLDAALARFRQFAEHGIYDLLQQAVALSVETGKMFILAAVIGFALVILTSRLQHFRMPWREGFLSAILLLILGVVIFALFSLPYIAISTAPNGDFYESRHLILFGIPIGLLAISLFRLVLSLPGTRPIALTILVFVLTVDLCALWGGYFHQQARWLRQDALRRGLQRAYQEPPAAVFSLTDYFLKYSIHTAFGASEVTGLLHMAWDDRPLLGFHRHESVTVLQDVDRMRKLPGSVLRNTDPWGPQATIELIPTQPALTNYGLSMRYYRCLAFLCDTDKLTDSLADTRINLGPIPHILGPKQDQGRP